MAECLITGTVTDMAGQPAANARLTFTRANGTILAFDDKVRVPDPVKVRADNTGAVSFSLVPGNYYANIARGNGSATVNISVPEEATADFVDLLDGLAPFTPFLLSQAKSYRDETLVARDEAEVFARRYGPVSLSELGYVPADGDVRDMITAALAFTRTNEVIIPYNASPWISLGTLTVPAGATIIFEQGARIAQNHVAIPGVQMLAGARLVRPYFTSTLYTRTTMEGLTLSAAMASYAHNMRNISIEGDDCQILDVQMLEYMAGGIKQTSGKGLRVTGLKARYLRSAEGYASAVDIGAENFGPSISTATDARIEVDTIEDCDRALEPEDGCSDITFVAAPGVLRRVWSRYYDIAANSVSQGFCISCHSHYYSIACRNIRYEGAWTCIDCVTPVFCDKSTGDATQMPQGFYVENVTIINTADFPTTFAAIGNRAQVWLQCHGADVTVNFQHPDGTLVPQARIEVNEGNGNRVSLRGPDVQAGLPWVLVQSGAVGSDISVDATDLSTQPVAGANPADNHLINVYGNNTVIRPRIHGVQYRGYVRLHARGCRVVDADFVMPAVNGPNAAIRYVGAGCIGNVVVGGAYRDPSNTSQLARFVTGPTGNLITGVAIYRASGTVVTIDSGANSNAIVTNVLGGGSISDGGTSNTVTPNY